VVEKAKDIIDLFDREWHASQNFLNLYQETADYVYPLEDQITRIDTGARPRAINLVDTTAIFAAQDMASGLSALLFPPGQQNFAIRSSDRELNETEEVQRYLSRFTEIMHDKLFESNFMMQLDQVLMSWLVFGEGCLKSERGEATDIVFQDYPAGSFVYLENHDHKIDTFIEKFKWTARQCVEKWGAGAVGEKIRKAYEAPETRQTKFDIIHLVGPRHERDMSKKIGNSIIQSEMPFTDVYVAVKDKHIIIEGGYDEFPFAIGRYKKSSREHRGRGIGSFVLPMVKSLQAIKRDFIESGNRRNRPPLEVTSESEGQISLDPGALNFTGAERQSIFPIQGVGGDYNSTKDIIEMEREEIRKAFMLDVFNQLTQLQGDRRTTLEISERLNEGLRRLTQPVGRLIPEVLSPAINRVALMLIRNDETLSPPEALEGTKFKVEYTSPMMLALKRHQASAFSSWMEFVAGVEEVFPGSRDNVNIDKGVRDMGLAFGVKEDHIRPQQEVDEIREQRQAQAEQQAELEALQVQAQAYGQGTTAPEQGSAAGEVLGQ